MKTTAIFSAALLGASILSYGAVAQTATDQTIVPGSEAQRELQNADSRDDVANNPGMNSAETVSPETQTLVPGSESQRELRRADGLRFDSGWPTEPPKAQRIGEHADAGERHREAGEHRRH